MDFTSCLSSTRYNLCVQGERSCWRFLVTSLLVSSPEFFTALILAAIFNAQCNKAVAAAGASAAIC